MLNFLCIRFLYDARLKTSSWFILSDILSAKHYFLDGSARFCKQAGKNKHKLIVEKSRKSEKKIPCTRSHAMYFQ